MRDLIMAMIFVGSFISGIALGSAYQPKLWRTIYAGPPESRERLEAWLKTPKGQEFGCWEVVSVQCPK